MIPVDRFGTERMDKSILAHSAGIDKVREDLSAPTRIRSRVGKTQGAMFKRISEDADRLAARSV